MKANKPYITTTHGMRGYFAVMVHTHEDGFEEPWQTGIGSHKTPEGAEMEAQMWAKDEGVEYRP